MPKSCYRVAGSLIVTSLFLSGCSWVKPSAGSHWVSLVKPQAVTDCQKIGVTTSTTLNKVVGLKRSDDKKMNEWVTLAKNQAVVMGGDTIIAKGQPDKGEQQFEVYRCK